MERGRGGGPLHSAGTRRFSPPVDGSSLAFRDWGPRQEQGMQGRAQVLRGTHRLQTLIPCLCTRVSQTSSQALRFTFPLLLYSHKLTFTNSQVHIHLRLGAMELLQPGGLGLES
jgi:hypothetical protein